MTVLQTGALPLGYVAILRCFVQQQRIHYINIYYIRQGFFYSSFKIFSYKLLSLQKLHYNISIINKTQYTVRAYRTHYHFTGMCSTHKRYKQAQYPDNKYSLYKSDCAS